MWVWRNGVLLYREGWPGEERLGRRGEWRDDIWFHTSHLVLEICSAYLLSTGTVCLRMGSKPAVVLQENFGVSEGAPGRKRGRRGTVGRWGPRVPYG